MDKKIFKKRETKAALINFDVETLKKIDTHAKRLGVTRTYFIETAMINTLKELDAEK